MAAGGKPVDAGTMVDTRQRLIDVAIDLFVAHSFAGTSLQMIADELGFTKAAIYHHFRTREELLDAVVSPIIERLSTIVHEAERQRSATARADHVLVGYATLAVDNRVISVLAVDPAVAIVIRERLGYGELIDRQLALLTAVDPGTGGDVKAAMVLAGIAVASGPMFAHLDRTTLRDDLVAAGRRALGLRTPHRNAIQPATGEGHP